VAWRPWKASGSSEFDDAAQSSGEPSTEVINTVADLLEVFGRNVRKSSSAFASSGRGMYEMGNRSPALKMRQPRRLNAAPGKASYASSIFSASRNVFTSASFETR
jgi:hypothetical protein